MEPLAEQVMAVDNPAIGPGPTAPERAGVGRQSFVRRWAGSVRIG